uniref:hypothetical protein n=1 Tax=Novosphingobium sp. HII-3 TaxID=2075565 RepID=UPI001304B532
PGPWFAGQTPYQRDSHPGQRCIGLALEEDGSVFGYRLHPNDDDGSYFNLSGFCSEADARLIAASPTMYDYIAKRAQGGDQEASDIMEAINASR